MRLDELKARSQPHNPGGGWGGIGPDPLMILAPEILALVEAVRSLAAIVGPECGGLSPDDEAVFKALDAFNVKLESL